jgi:hypothetical protein
MSNPGHLHLPMEHTTHHAARKQLLEHGSYSHMGGGSTPDTGKNLGHGGCNRPHPPSE